MKTDRHTFPAIIAVMITFDMLPDNDMDLIKSAARYLHRLKGCRKEKNILTQCDAGRVRRLNDRIVVDFLNTKEPENEQIRLRLSYMLSSPSV